MNRRERLLDAIAAHIANGDERLAMRIYVENKISFSAFMEARDRGLQIAKKQTSSRNP